MTENKTPPNSPHLEVAVSSSPSFLRTLHRIFVQPVTNWFSMFWAGFTSMSRLGRTLWIVVIVKLVIMFGILKPFFFPRFLNSKEDKVSYVGEELIDRASSPQNIP